MTPRLAQALAYHERGWALLPIQPGGKEPHYGVLQAVYGESSTTALRSRRASTAEIRVWLARDLR